MQRVTETAAPRVSPPAWIDDLFACQGLSGASRLGWGFRNETWKVDLTDGRRLAATRLADATAAASIASLVRLLGPRLHDVGVPSPNLVDPGPAAPPGVIVTEFVEGTPGAELLDDDEGAALVGSVLGETWTKLARIDPSGLPVRATPRGPVGDGPFIAPLARVRRWLTSSEQHQVAAAIEAGVELLADRKVGLVHGDLVPVNVLVRGGRLAALLDFESVQVADPLLDAAWFDWIVAFHHPDREAAAWRGFVASSGLDPGDEATRGLLRILPLMRLVEILADDRLADDRAGHWLGMLRACLARYR
jgi:aminoglycoside phosphotransferase (APT) family kinase protein